MSDPRKTPSIFTRGAVDLGALRARSAPASSSPAGQPAPESSERRGAAGTRQRTSTVGGSSAVIIDVTEATFQTEVLERSLRTPVLVNFWATWSAPSKQLSDLLETLAQESGGGWVLANVDVDASQRLVQMFQLQGIPLVYAIVGGRPVDAFSGVLPEAELRQWIGAVCGTTETELAAVSDPRIEAADDALTDGDLDTAEQAYRKILAESPADPAAEAGLAQVGLLRRAGTTDPGRVLAAAAAAPDDVPSQTLAADVEVLAGRAAEAYQRLTALIRRVDGDEKDVVRKHLLSLFAIAGPDDPAVAVARRALASALF